MRSLFKLNSTVFSPWETWKRTYDLHFHYCPDAWTVWQGYEDDPIGGWSTGQSYKTQADAIKAICKFLNIPTFDEWRIKRKENKA